MQYHYHELFEEKKTFIKTAISNYKESKNLIYSRSIRVNR